MSWSRLRLPIPSMAKCRGVRPSRSRTSTTSLSAFWSEMQPHLSMPGTHVVEVFDLGMDRPGLERAVEPLFALGEVKALLPRVVAPRWKHAVPLSRLVERHAGCAGPTVTRGALHRTPTPRAIGMVVHGDLLDCAGRSRFPNRCTRSRRGANAPRLRQHPLVLRSSSHVRLRTSSQHRTAPAPMDTTGSIVIDTMPMRAMPR